LNQVAALLILEQDLTFGVNGQHAHGKVLQNLLLLVFLVLALLFSQEQLDLLVVVEVTVSLHDKCSKEKRKYGSEHCWLARTQTPETQVETVHGDQKPSENRDLVIWGEDSAQHDVEHVEAGLTRQRCPLVTRYGCTFWIELIPVRAHRACYCHSENGTDKFDSPRKLDAQQPADRDRDVKKDEEKEVHDRSGVLFANMLEVSFV
jgi:hypothetical protein